jgi:hypothetical protein
MFYVKLILNRFIKALDIDQIVKFIKPSYYHSLSQYRPRLQLTDRHKDV